MIQRVEVGKKRSWEDEPIAFPSSQLQFRVCSLYTLLTVWVIRRLDYLMLSLQIDNIRKYLIGSGDNFCVELETSLRCDQ